MHELYSHRDLEGFRSSVVKIVSGVVSSELASYNEIDLRSPETILIQQPVAPDSPGIKEAFDSYIGQHPFVKHFGQSGDGRAGRVTDFLPQREFRQLGLYNEYYRYVGVDRSLAVGLLHTPSQRVGVSFARSGKEFSEREKLIINTLRPHLIQARQNAAAVERNKSELRNFHQAMEESGGGVISLSRERKVQFCTAAARRWLLKYFWPAEKEDRLPEDLRRWVEHQCSLLSGGESPPQQPLVLERGDEKITIRLVDDGAQEGGGYLLLLEEQSPPISPQHLTSSLGLTRRESEILYLVARGETDQQVASSLYVSTRTVNKHLQNIYRKLGVSRRAEAISKVLQASGYIRP